MGIEKRDTKGDKSIEMSLQAPYQLLRNHLDSIRPIDSIYLGEIYCEGRMQTPQEMVSICRKIKELGKKVYLVTPVLTTSRTHLRKVRTLFELAGQGIANGVCVNDLGALEIGLREFPDVALFVGPYIEVRNTRCAKIFESFGVNRILLPYDLSKDAIHEITKDIKVEVEIMVHGPIPLMVSRRCLLRRAKGLPHKDGACKIDPLCKTYPNGMDITESNSEVPIFTLGGRVLYSKKTYCLFEHIDEIGQLGVRAVRFEEWNMLQEDMYYAYKKRLSGEDTKRGLGISSNGFANGFFFGVEGLRYVNKRESAPENETRLSDDTGWRPTPTLDEDQEGVLYRELLELVSRVQKHPTILKKIKDIKREIVLFEVVDTGERCFIEVKNGATFGPVRGEPRTPPSLVAQAKEETFLRLLRGELDPDAAYLLRKIRFKGPFFGAVRLKHILSSMT
jgi:putative protease